MFTRIIILMTALLVSTSTLARDDVSDYDVEEALNLERSKEKLGTGVKFYFGDSKPASIEKTFGEFGTNKKTNAFNKTDKEACQWAFLSAMVALRDRAVREGGNAVVNIKSNYRGNLTTSDTTFKCGAGNVLAGVALVGTVVKLAD